ncbi:MAG: glycosyltransferase family 4 protein, partial [Methanobacteriaceae archaeon]|nr:glycosyltransferase family 4 protein [Methanobacteriaceae archaeon]
HLMDDDLYSNKKQFENVSRFYNEAKLTVIRPGFIRIPLLDYASYSINSKKEIKNIIEDFKPDFVIGFTSIISAYWGMRYAKKNDIPFIYYWLDVNHELIPFRPLRPIAKIIEKHIIRNSAAIIAINEVLKDYMVNLGNNGINAYVVPGGVDFNRFNPIEVDSKFMRKKYGISEEDFVLFFMGWIYEFSGLEEVIMNLLEIKDSYPHIKLIIVGEGDHYSKLNEIVKSNNIEDKVILTGKRPYEEIPQLIAASDICLLPAHNNEIMKDIVPIKIYEYLAMNKPVISTKLNGVLKEFGHNNGLIYVESPNEVIDRLIDLKPEDIEKNKIHSQKFIQKYGWEEIIPEFNLILNNYKEIIKK